MKPAPVARIRVGKSSGSQLDIQVNCPDAKQPSSAASARSRRKFDVHWNSTGVSSSNNVKKANVIGLRA